MKRISLIILAVAAILAGSVSCNKNEINPENPLTSSSFVIVPDYSDGTIDNIVPELLEDDTWKYPLSIDVQVTPAKYAEELVNSGNFNFKATFSPVETKSGIGDAFTISPNSVTYHEGTDAPYLTLDFDFDPATGETLVWEPYAVSISAENRDGNQAASTAFVPLNDYSILVPDLDDLEYPYYENNQNWLPGLTTITYAEEQEELSDGQGESSNGLFDPDFFVEDGLIPYTSVFLSNREAIRDPNGGMLPLSDWMSRVKDATPINQMTIPGTHDSATGYIPYSSTAISALSSTWTLTQFKTISSQLDFGVRCFDIRLYGETLEAYHGPIDCGSNFTSILEDDIFPFLDQHKTEGVILVLKQEHIAKFFSHLNEEAQIEDYSYGINKIAEKVRRGEPGYDHILLNPDLSYLTMGEFRGKVVIIFRDIITYDEMSNNIFIGEYVDHNSVIGGYNPWSGANNTFSRIKNAIEYPMVAPTHDGGIRKLFAINYHPKEIVDYSHPTDNDKFYYYVVQDNYEYNEFQRKLEDIIINFKDSGSPQRSRKNALYFNHISGYLNRTAIKKCAYGENAYYLNHSSSLYLKKTSSVHGIIIMDYVGCKLVKIKDRNPWNVYGDDLCITCIEHNFYGDKREEYTFPYTIETLFDPIVDKL